MKILASFFAAFCLFFSSPFIASAHVVIADGEIGAAFHVDADDDPIVGETSLFYFHFKDTSDRWKSSLCNCKVEIKQGGKIVLLREIFADGINPDLHTPSFSYVFPKRGIYHMTLSGTPKQVGAFQPFSLTYDIRVSRVSEATATPSFFEYNSSLNFIIIGVAGLFLAAVLFGRKPKNEKKKNKKHYKYKISYD